MKNLIYSFLLILPLVSIGQDKIYFTNGNVLEAKLSLIDLKEVRYKKYNNLNGPDYVLEKWKIDRIEYENGVIDYFEGSPPDTASNDNSSDQISYYTENHFERANQEPEEPNSRIREPNGVSVVLLGPTLIGALQYDYFINPKWNFEVGVGLIGIYSGFSYHFGGDNPNKNTTPYIGLRGTLGLIASDFINFGPRFGRGIMLPFGFNVNTKSGIYVRPELAAWYTYSTNGWAWGAEQHAVRPWVGLALGWRL